MRTIWLMGLLGLLLLAGCGGTTILPAGEAAAFADKVDAITENLLVALSTHHHAAYIRDMDTKMKAASSESEFEKVYAAIIGKIGPYVSRQMVQVADQGQYRIVVYDAKFEKEEHVTVRVVYDKTKEPPLVSGLWFDSPKLRQK